MEKRYNIAIDIMGGDNAPIEIVKGAVESLLENEKTNLTLIGQEEIINKELLKYKYDKNRINIVNATEIIETHDVPTKAIRTKKDSSMVVGFNLLKENTVDAFISAGNTGALLTGSTIKVGRLEGIERPTLGTIVPTQKNYMFLTDCGANVDCKPSYLVQFAKMGSVYAENILGIKNPKVGLINVGVEETKGNALSKEAYNLLKESNVNFVGNVESREIVRGVVDVVVCDGFIGNILLKNIEGLSMTLLSMLKEELMSSTKTKIGALLSKQAFLNLKTKMDSSEIGGAPFLGLKNLVVKAHGSSKAKDIKSAVRQTYNFIDNDMIEKIKQKL